MAQRVIDGVLFSPVPAHQLEPGDLLYSIGTARRVVAVSRDSIDGIHSWVILDTMDALGSDQIAIELNHPVLRAVGARAGRGGAR